MIKKSIILITIILLLLIQFPFVRHFLLTRAGSLLIHQDKLEPADAIFVLGGGKKERALQGIYLYKDGYGKNILFTGETYDPIFGDTTHWALEAQKLAVSLGIPKDSTVPILNSKNTYDDAVLSKYFCSKNGITTLLVVTEPYHSLRSFLTFQKVYSYSGIKIIIYPVQDSWYKKDTWWKSKEGIMFTYNEYIKLIYNLFKSHLI